MPVEMSFDACLVRPLTDIPSVRYEIQDREAREIAREHDFYCMGNLRYHVVSALTVQDYLMKHHNMSGIDINLIVVGGALGSIADSIFDLSSKLEQVANLSEYNSAIGGVAESIQNIAAMLDLHRCGKPDDIKKR